MESGCFRDLIARRAFPSLNLSCLVTTSETRGMKFGPKGIISLTTSFKRKQLTRGIKCKRHESSYVLWSKKSRVSG